MVSLLAFWCLLGGFCVSVLDAGSSQRPHISRVKSAAYDELYADAKHAYNLEKWGEAVSLFEKAIADYKQEKDVKIHCRRNCRDKYRASSSSLNFMKDLELDYYRYTIYSHKCSQQCREKYLGKRTKVSLTVKKDFESRMTYAYLQFAYHKVGRNIDAARAAYTCTEIQAQDKSMADNVKIYKSMPGIEEAGIYSLEPTLHQENYFNSAKLYEAEEWEEAIQGFEDALKEYFIAYENCKIMCEEEREQNKILSRSGLFGVHVDVLQCRTQCPDQLRKVKGIYVKNYLARHFNYLQMSYFKVEKLWEAASCAASFLLFEPDEDTMIDNLRYFKHALGHDSIKITAREGSCMPILHVLFIYSLHILVDSHREQFFVKRALKIHSRGSCHSIHLDLDLYGLFQKTAKLGDGYDTRNSNDKPFSFTDKETFSGVTILSASEAALNGKASVEEVELYFKLSEKVRHFTEDYFQLDTPLYFSYSHLVCRTSVMDPNGHNEFHLSHPIHSDNCLLNRDGLGTCPKRSPAYTWRDFSALLYLNGDFTGGEFLFANPDESVQARLKPECGRAVAFSAGQENLHGVAGIRKGQRCALALWFTLRQKHNETQRQAAWNILQKAKEQKQLKQLPLFTPEVATHMEL
ncbi:PREDICTED: prolyl 3-hydroxylase 2-like [Acropora digitifera]|uniref:prolyl 3-hydroxylase 2-like n=1 Tax=Acropora digitifera TaxID=70779 RepID=UPI00077AB203|nr:PREDICTED: prolyl 3-hydroxylase 2-like [Acropora digitifera]